MTKSRHPVPLTDDVLELIAARFRVLGDPTRLKLLSALESGEKNVSELIAVTGATQTNVSRQLGILANAGLLARRKSGLSVYYRIVDKEIFDLCGHVCKSLRDRFRKENAIFASQS